MHTRRSPRRISWKNIALFIFAASLLPSLGAQEGRGPLVGRDSLALVQIALRNRRSRARKADEPRPNRSRRGTAAKTLTRRNGLSIDVSGIWRDSPVHQGSSRRRHSGAQRAA